MPGCCEDKQLLARAFHERSVLYFLFDYIRFGVEEFQELKAVIENRIVSPM